MDDVVIHDGPVIKNGFIEPSDRPGLGLELNPDVVKAPPWPRGESYDRLSIAFEPCWT